MAEVNMSQIKYLSDKGLSKLWEKISSTFLRDSEVVDALTVSGEGRIITSADEVFVQKKKLDDATSKLSARIEEVAAAQGTNIDGETIINKDGVLQTNLILSNDKDNHTLSIITGGEESTVVSTWDYTEFYQEAVKDGILDSVSLVVIPKDEATTESRSDGTYLKFVFNTSSGKDPIYVNVTDLIDVYAGSDYISVEKGDGTSTISLDTAKLVEHLKGQDIYNVTSLISRVENVESEMLVLKKLVEDLQKAWGELDITGLQERVATNAANLNNLTEYVNGLPNTPITDEEIMDLP